MNQNIQKSHQCVLSRNIYSEYLKDKELKKLEAHILNCRECIREVQNVSTFLSDMKSLVPYQALDTDALSDLSNEIDDLFLKLNKKDVEESKSKNLVTKKLLLALGASAIVLIAVMKISPLINF